MTCVQQCQRRSFRVNILLYMRRGRTAGGEKAISSPPTNRPRYFLTRHSGGTVRACRVGFCFKKGSQFIASDRQIIKDKLHVSRQASNAALTEQLLSQPAAASTAQLSSTLTARLPPYLNTGGLLRAGLAAV